MLVGSIVLTLVNPLGCGNSPSNGPGSGRSDSESPSSADAGDVKPNNFQVERFRRTIQSARLSNISEDEVVEMGNAASAEQISFMYDFSNLMKNLGMSGDDICLAINQIEDPFPEKGFPVKRGPVGFENMGIDALLKRAKRAFHQSDQNNMTLGSRYDAPSKTLFITMTRDDQER